MVVDRARSDFAAIAETLGLTALQARTVLWLEHHSAMRDLADHLACDASNVTGLADRLEKRGVVRRVPADGDRRVKQLELTPEGARLRARLVRRVAKGSTVTARLTPQERQSAAPPWAGCRHRTREDPPHSRSRYETMCPRSASAPRSASSVVLLMWKLSRSRPAR